MQKCREFPLLQASRRSRPMRVTQDPPQVSRRDLNEVAFVNIFHSPQPGWSRPAPSFRGYGRNFASFSFPRFAPFPSQPPSVSIPLLHPFGLPQPASPQLFLRNVRTNPDPLQLD